uniref:Neurotrimin-like n=1 Tax=Crassostrea virginica TaxID=6565 RepID=A0A8B8DP30_CRAVI|nr:neurotrimin-like [Crassostrea virginica]
MLNIMFLLIWTILICLKQYCTGTAELVKYGPGADVIILYCRVNNRQNGSWKRNEAPLTVRDIVLQEAQRIKLLPTDYDLEITKTKKTDEGIYTCIDDSKEIKRYRVVAKEKAMIQLYSGPTIEVMESSTVHLWCNATGYPEPTVTWHVYQQSAQQEIITPIGISGRMLGLRNVSESCAAKFQCQAINTYNMKEHVARNITLKVVSKDSTSETNGTS